MNTLAHPRMRIVSKEEMIVAERLNLQRETHSLLPAEEANMLLSGKPLGVHVDGETGRQLQALMPRLARHFQKYGVIEALDTTACKFCGDSGELVVAGLIRGVDGVATLSRDPQDATVYDCPSCESERSAAA